LKGQPRILTRGGLRQTREFRMQREHSGLGNARWQIDAQRGGIQ
jgi:hypothetical protein